MNLDGRRLARMWRSLRDSLLFVPLLMAIGALVLFFGTSLADVLLGDPGRLVAGESPLWFIVFTGSGEAARSLLGTIAGTWATIAGVVYSVTLVTIQLSATKYSAQVIPAFERDRLNQIVLGLFTATVVYSLLVLKTVRSGDGAFVPVVGVNVSVVLAIGSLFLLIAFIGNLTAYIRPTRFVDDLARRGIERLEDARGPDVNGAYEPVNPPESGREGAVKFVESDTRGRLARVDWDALAAVLGTSEAVGEAERVELLVAVGERVMAGEPVLALHGARSLSDEEAESLQAPLHVESVPDVAHPNEVAETLGDISITALSQGSLDVGVAMSASVALLDLARESMRKAPVPRAYHVAPRRILLVTRQQTAHEAALVALKRTLDSAAREGRWDVAETVCSHLPPVLLTAARCDEETWSAMITWLRPVAAQVFGYGDEAFLRRATRSLVRGSARLRHEGLASRALDVDATLVEAAREAGVEPRLRGELAGHAAPWS